MKTLTRSTGTMLTLAAAVALIPLDANAQERDTLDQECTAEVSPAQVEAGSEAVRVTVTLSEDIGTVTGLEQKDPEQLEQEHAHGITLASPMDVPRTPMAAGDEAPTPVQMGADQLTWILWLNTSEAEEGTHSVFFVAGENRCAAELDVVPTG